MILVFYSIYTIAAAAIDAWRIRATWGKVKNINHWISYAIAFAGITGLWIAYNGFILQWSALAFLFACVCVRGVLYSPALNLLRREHIDYTSTTTNAITDHTQIPFWGQRALYLAGLVAVIALNYLFPVLKFM